MSVGVGVAAIYSIRPAVLCHCCEGMNGMEWNRHSGDERFCGTHAQWQSDRRRVFATLSLVAALSAMRSLAYLFPPSQIAIGK